MDKNDHYKVVGASKGIKHAEYYVDDKGELQLLETEHEAKSKETKRDSKDSDKSAHDRYWIRLIRGLFGR